MLDLYYDKQFPISRMRTVGLEYLVRHGLARCPGTYRTVWHVPGYVPRECQTEYYTVRAGGPAVWTGPGDVTRIEVDCLPIPGLSYGSLLLCETWEDEYHKALAVNTKEGSEKLWRSLRRLSEVAKDVFLVRDGSVSLPGFVLPLPRHKAFTLHSGGSSHRSNKVRWVFEVPRQPEYRVIFPEYRQ